MAVSVPKLLLANVGGTELFKCDYEYNLQLDNQIPDFYKQIMFYWRDIAAVKPKAKIGSL